MMENLKRVFGIGIGALFLLSLAFYNKFPFLYPDTASYLHYAFNEGIPNDRPVIYSLFIRLSSIGINLWTVVLTQALMVSYLVHLALEKNTKASAKHKVAVLVFLGLATTVAFPVGQLMPDIFSAIAILSIALLLTVRLSTPETIALSLFFVLAASMHGSHLILSLVALLVSIIFWHKSIISKKRLLLMASLTLLPWLLVPAVHFAKSSKFTIIEKSHLFHFNRLNEIGLVDKYFEQRCPDPDFRLCEYQGKISNDFLWDYDNSPLYQLGGWDANEKEYKTVVREIYQSPKLWPKLITSFITNGLKQSFNFRLFDIRPVEGDMVAREVLKYYPNQHRSCTSSYQESDFSRLKEVALWRDAIHYLTFLISTLFLIIAIPSESKRVRRLVLFVILLVVVNAFITGGLSTVVPRYQARVIWLIPFLACLVYLGRYVKK